MKTLSPSRRSFASFVPLCTALVALFCTATLTAGISTLQPIPVYPANNAVLKCPTTTVILRWNEMAGVSTYFIDVASDAAMKNHIYQKVVQFDTSLNISIPTTAISYYWTVSTGAETSSPVAFSTAFVQKVGLNKIGRAHV